MEPEILDTQIIYQHGSFMQIRRWLKGIHPELGRISMGWTGFETIVEKDVIKPLYTFFVKDDNVA